LEGVSAKHAVIARDRDESGNAVQVLRPLQGPTAVERGGQRFNVGDWWVLADGDLIIVGVWRLTYRNLGAKRTSSRKIAGNKEGIPWYRP
jgi:hypothetical protein